MLNIIYISPNICLCNNYNTIIRSTDVHEHGRGADFFFVCVSAQPYGICTRFIYLTQTHLYVEHHTEKH